MDIDEKASHSGNTVQVTSFAGMNYTDNISDGEYADGLNMGSSAYPYMTCREDRTRYGELSGVDSIYGYDKLVEITGTDIYYGGTLIGNCSEGIKQYAQINSQLIIWPDKLCIDTTTGKLWNLNETINSTSISLSGKVATVNMTSTETGEQSWSGNTYKYDEELYLPYFVTYETIGGTPTLKKPKELKKGDMIIPMKGNAGRYVIYPLRAEANVISKKTVITSLIKGKVGFIGDSITTYDKSGYKVDGYNMWYPANDVTDVSYTWWYKALNSVGATLDVNASSSGSRVTNTRSDRPDFYTRCGKLNDPDTIIVALGTNDSDNSVALGSYDYTTATASLSEATFRTAYIKGIRQLKANYPDANIICVAFKMDDDYADSIEAIAEHYGLTFISVQSYTAYSGPHPNKTGMTEISNAVVSACEVKTEETTTTDTSDDRKAELIALEQAGENTDGVYFVIDRATAFSADDKSIQWDGAYVYWWATCSYTVYGKGGDTMDDHFDVGDRLTIKSSDGTTQYEKLLVASIAGSAITFDMTDSFTTKTLTGGIIEREVPDLDYICALDNRLWGVSNTVQNRIYDAETQTYSDYYSRVIYSSALGLPSHWYDYDGISTDSYAVAVDSPGDFTAICAYSGDIYCWKERKLHKVTGSYPSEYYMYTYDIEGVLDGAYKSLQIINEVLYYLGREGVYSYTGSQPSMVSAKLGRRVPGKSSGAGTITSATDGLRYYLSAWENAGADAGLYVYDTRYGYWYTEDAESINDMTGWGSTVYIATTDGTLAVGTGAGDSSTEWSCTFMDYTEDTHYRKRYHWLRIRAEIPEGCEAYAGLTIDDLPEQVCWRSFGSGERTWDMPLPNMRCDKIVLRFWGTGPVIIKSIQREYTVMSMR